jgi:hypothetical protein
MSPTHCTKSTNVVERNLEPTVIVYILWVYPPLLRRWTLAVDALRPLADRPELIERAHAVNRRREWTALLLGAAFSIWVTRPWQFDGRWLLLYLYASNVVMFSLMALAIYDCLMRTQRLTRIVRAGLQLDLFDRRSYTPVARWGQRVSLTFVGGTCLSLLFQSFEALNTLRSLVIYSTVVVVSLTLFFTSIWSIHDALVAAQQRELALIHQHWSTARSEFKRKLAEGAAARPPVSSIRSSCCVRTRARCSQRQPGHSTRRSSRSSSRRSSRRSSSMA